VTAMCISGLLPREKAEVEGSILLDGHEIFRCSPRELRSVQGDEMAVIFQEPMTSFNPVRRIGVQVEESLRVHGHEAEMTERLRAADAGMSLITGRGTPKQTTRVGFGEGISRAERRTRALEALEMAELPDPEAVYRMYPHELSGGMLQRAMIAAAIISRPKLLIADEPTTALDVTIQAQILELLRKLNAQTGMAILFISHNLQVVRRLCRSVIVMQRGKIVEERAVEEIFRDPHHPYTRELIAAIPADAPRRSR